MQIRYSIKAITPHRRGDIPKPGQEWDYNEVIIGADIRNILSRAAKFLNEHYGEGQWVVTREGQFCHRHGVAGDSTLLYIDTEIVEDGDE